MEVNLSDGGSFGDVPGPGPRRRERRKYRPGYSENIKAMFEDSRNGKPREEDINGMIVGTKMERKQIQKSFDNRRFYIQKKIRALLIKFHIEDSHSEHILTIAQDLAIRVQLVIDTFNKYKAKILEAVGERKRRTSSESSCSLSLDETTSDEKEMEEVDVF